MISGRLKQLSAAVFSINYGARAQDKFLSIKHEPQSFRSFLLSTVLT